MAYHVGLCAAKTLNLEPIAVTVRDETQAESTFTYEDTLRSVTIDQLSRLSTKNDFLVINPSFSKHFLGLEVQGRKICYVQHFNTYSILDGFFDLYVSVSKVVQSFLSSVYMLDTPVIEPFIEATVYDGRAKTDQFLMPMKFGNITSRILARVRDQYEHTYNQSFPAVHIQETTQLHGDWMESMQNFQYYLSLVPCEGFGLMPLEAMQAGCIVAGFDGVGGRDYLNDGQNSMTTHYPDVSGVAERVHSLYNAPEHQVETLRKNALETASNFTKDRFYRQWTTILESNFSPPMH